jgi:osmotically-inducible protein OsmY
MACGDFWARRKYQRQAIRRPPGGRERGRPCFPGAESDAKTVHSDLDKGIENNLHAALVQNKLEDNVKFDVKNGVVKLTGDVNSQALRSQAAQIASAVPNVQQVVNEVQVKNQRATSSN